MKHFNVRFRCFCFRYDDRGGDISSSKSAAYIEHWQAEGKFSKLWEEV